MYRLATIYSVTDRRTDDITMPKINRAHFLQYGRLKLESTLVMNNNLTVKQ